MPQAGIILYLRPLSPVSFILARRSFHKFYFALEKKFAQITFHISILDPWLESGQIQKLLSHLLVKANRFILTIDGWLDEVLLDSWMGKDANRLWESVVRYVYKKRGLKFDIPGMNPSADEETLSAVEVPEINQVTVATVTTTSTTNTQIVAGAGACYIPLFTGYAPQQALSNYRYQSPGYQQSVADYQEHPITSLG